MLMDLIIILMMIKNNIDDDDNSSNCNSRISPLSRSDNDNNTDDDKIIIPKRVAFTPEQCHSSRKEKIGKSWNWK